LQENIARVTVNPETKQILDIHLYERNLRFKCKKCAIYCCKLGGPNLTKKDIEQIRHTVHDTSKVIEPAKRKYGKFSLTRNMI
jgi:Fe-S-cluster containining protein